MSSVISSCGATPTAVTTYDGAFCALRPEAGDPEPYGYGGTIPIEITIEYTVTVTPTTSSTAAATPTPQALAGWTYQGCYQDGNARTLPGATFTSTSMTAALCADFCWAGGWLLMGVENGNECFCDNGPVADGLAADAATCSTPCLGGPGSACGGGWRLNVWRREGPVPRIQTVAGWTYYGCYTDDWARTLADSRPAGTALTPAVCAGLCAGRRFFGVENGNECFCGDELVAGRLAADSGTCSTACTGQPNLACGGGWRLSVYHRAPPPAQQVAGWANVSCVVDGTSRSLTGASFNEAGMTAERCSTLCCGWRYFGVSYGTECYCGNEVAASGVEAPLADCDMPCGGNSGYACGAGWRLNLYSDLPGDAPGCASSCGIERSCSQANCRGTFSLANGLSTCTGAFRDCPCVASAETCGPPLSCDLNGCAGTFDADGYPTCKGFFKGCRCLPTAATCSTNRSCDATDCAGRFDLSDGVAYCSTGRVGCPCNSTPTTCGTPLSCDLNGCAGTYQLGDVYPTCKGFFKGCRCVATANTCGSPQSCDLNGCNGGWDGQGVARCQGFFQGCQCAPTANTCGNQQSCDLNNCYGSFNLDDGLAYCRGWWSGCRCLSTDNTCGQQQSCDANGCAGSFDLGNGLAYCRGKFAGCRCLATDNTCGQQQSCDANGCAGGYGSDGIARCRGKFAGCRCQPTSNTCGQPLSCDLNGCNGGWDSQGVARCRSNFAGCVCEPTANTCGTPQSCSSGGCNGIADGAGQGWCTDYYAGCRCNAVTSTPGYCGVLTTCSWSGCQGVNVGQQFGRCRSSSHYDCPCTLPSTASPAPAPAQCQSDCIAIINQLYRLPDWVCTTTSGLAYDSGYNGGLDWYKIGAYGSCELALSKMAVSHGFPDAFCLSRSTIQSFVSGTAYNCMPDLPWYIKQGMGIPSNFVGEGSLCLSSPGRASFCGHNS